MFRQLSWVFSSPSVVNLTIFSEPNAMGPIAMDPRHAFVESTCH